MAARFSAWITIVALVVTFAIDADAKKKRRKRKRGNRRGPRGALVIDSAVKGATIFVDGTKIGITPVKQQALTPGEHTIKVTKLGHLDYEETVSITKGRTSKVFADLLPFAGILTVKVNVAGAEVLVDGKLIGKAPLEKELKLGSHTITVKKKGYAAYVEELRSDPGNEYAIKAELIRENGTEEPAIEDDPMALAALPDSPGGGDELALEPLAPTGGGDELALEPLAPTSPGGGDDLELALVPPPESTSTTEPSALDLVALPADATANNSTIPPPDAPNALTTASSSVEEKKPWYLQWWALTAGSVIVAGVVVGASVAATSGGGGGGTRPDRIWVPGQSFEAGLVRF